MATIGFNKITHIWQPSSTPEVDFLPTEDWVVDPVFADGEQERCMSLGPKYWKYSGSTISCMTDQEIDVDPGFLAQAKLVKIEELSAACGNAITNGFPSDALGTTHIYDSELEDQLNLIGSVTATAPDADHPAGHVQYYACRDASTGVKSYIEHTHEQLKKIAADGALVKLYHLQQFAIKRYTVEQQTSISAVNAITW